MSTKVIVMGANGRMGRMISTMAAEDPNVELAAVVERPGCVAGLEAWACTTGTGLDEVLPNIPGGVVISFTSPEATVEAARKCAEYGNPLVAGTTGLNDEELAEMKSLAEKTPIFWAPNTSVGVNVLLKVLPELVRLLGEDYDLDMVELHHNKKKDAPSGTAIRLAQCLAEARDWEYGEVARYSREGLIGERPKKEIGVQTIRGGDVVGVHTVFCMGPGERIEVTHHAHSRETFAAGALRAAKWIGSRRPGRLYSMEDVLA